jgi:hypothetical protein
MTLTFSALIQDLRSNMNYNREILEACLKRNPAIAYQKVNEIARIIGSRYRLDLQIHFPDRTRLKVVDSYGAENLGIVFDKHRKRFPIEREVVKRKALDLISSAKVDDAYMYEGKEGVRVTFGDGRLEILPGSIHLWCDVSDKRIKAYVDWLFSNVYYKENDC